MSKSIILTSLIITFPISSYCATPQHEIANDDNSYVFDSTLLKGSGFPIDDVINYISTDKIKPGNYSMDVNLNGLFLFNDDINLKYRGNNSQVCFSEKQIQKISFKKISKKHLETCMFLNEISPNSSVHIDIKKMLVEISIPDIELNKKPRGYVSLDELSEGETMLSSNYSINQYYSHFNNTNNSNYESTWVALNNALNIGKLQFRHQGSWSHSTPGITTWTTTRAYFQRAILPIKSNLTAGDSYTAGRFFSGMAFRGIVLNSDERMLPQSQRGYAPIVRGTAKSNAKVTINQGKSVIYESTVPPGNFEIQDLYPVSYSGDLVVTVKEADGSATSYTVPYAAGPESVRPGFLKYSTIVGRSRYIGNNDPFAEFIIQYGVNNNITINIGNRTAKGYFSGILGYVYSSELGAFGLDSNFSQANLPSGNQTGWMLHTSYSKRIEPTNTTIAIAGYRYSTKGYRDLSDVFGLRDAWDKNNTHWISSTLNQLSRFEVSVTQNLDLFGNLWLSGSTQAYRDDRNDDKQYQFGYSKQFNNGITINGSIARTRSSQIYQSESNTNIGYDNYINNYYTANRQTLSALTLSIPFGSRRQNTLSSTLTQQNGVGSSLQSTLSGTTDKEHPINYGITFARDYTHNNSLGATLQTATSVGSVQGTASQAKNYYQGSAGLQGAVVIHNDGVTTGPYLGETFALIEAKGAEGAKVQGAQYAVIDKYGFALSPSVAPYQYNNITLDSTGLNKHAELITDSQRIAPLSGAMMRVKFSVINGYPMFITITYEQPLPVGATIYSKDSKAVGIVGQNNQAWVRYNKLSDNLIIKWGNNKSCDLSYNIPESKKDDEIIKIKGKCI